MHVLCVNDTKAFLTAPTQNDNKYTRGVVGIIAGSSDYPGASILVTEAAVQAGAGYVRYIGPRRCEDLILSRRPEVVIHDGRTDVWVIGPGITQLHVDQRFPLITTILSQASQYTACVIDAGALETFAQYAVTHKASYSHVVITPHTGELLQLLHSLQVNEVKQDSITAHPAQWAIYTSHLLQCCVVLKGAETFIAIPEDNNSEQSLCLSVKAPTFWLSTAGTGDILAGIIGSLLAQNKNRFINNQQRITAIATGVMLHGYAAGLASHVLTEHQLIDPMQSTIGMMNSPHRYAGHPLTALQIAHYIPQARELIMNSLLVKEKNNRL